MKLGIAAAKQTACSPVPPIRWGIPSKAEEVASFGRSVGRWPAFVDSATALQYVKRYYMLVIVSNVDRASFAKSNEKLGVEFDRVITAQDVGSYKPSLRNFDYAVSDLKQSLGVEKIQILHTAQSIFHDIVPAKSVGLKTLWINRRKEVGGWGATPAPGAVGPISRSRAWRSSLRCIRPIYTARPPDRFDSTAIRFGRSLALSSQG